MKGILIAGLLFVIVFWGATASAGSTEGALPTVPSKSQTPSAQTQALRNLLSANRAGAPDGDKDDYLSDDEADQVRDAQAPSERIELYLSLAELRLTRIDDFRNRPRDSEYDIPAYLETQFDQYIRITDALKDWIQDHFDRQDDMRAGLKKVLETGPHQLERLRRIEQSPDAYAAGYRKSLDDAIDDFTDALDGATKALSAQSRQFGELKREEKADAQTAKTRAKDEKKRAKEEDKLRKKEHEKGVPADKDEN